MVRCFSPERASVKIDSGLNTETTVSKTETSWSVGMWCQFLWSFAKTALIACYCSKILSIIWNVDSHLVATSDINFCCSSPSWIYFSHKSQCFFQLLLKTATKEWHLLKAFCTLSNWMALSTQRSKLRPKQQTTNIYILNIATPERKYNVCGCH